MPSIEEVKYHLDELPWSCKVILFANDVRIMQEYDQPPGILSVYSKSLNSHFDFAYKNNDFEDWTIFLPGQQ